MHVLKKLIKRNKLFVILSVCLTLIANLSQMIYMLYIAKLINNIEAGTTIESSLILILCLFLISNAVTNFFNHYISRYTSEKMAHTLRTGYMRNLLHTSIEATPSAMDSGTDAAHTMSVLQNELAQANSYLGNNFFEFSGMLLTGTGSSQPQGALNVTNGVTAAATNAVTADELIELQACVKQAYQANACWTMSPATFTAIKKLKGQDLHYLLQDDFSQDFPYRLLGKPVYLSDNMPDMGAGKKAILYGDYSGLSVNFRENIGIEVLRELYAAQHVLGVVSWFEFDSKVTDAQKLAVLTMKAS